MYGRTRDGSRASETGDVTAGRIRYVGAVVPTFGLLLLVTAAVTWAAMVTGFASAAFETFGFVGVLVLLALQGCLALGAVACREAYPINVVFAVAFAAFEGVLLAPIVAGYLSADLGVVLAQALGITAVAFVSLSAVPLVTNLRVGFLGGVLFAGLLGLSGLWGTALVVGLPSRAELGISGFAVVLFGLFVLYDTSRILENEWGPVAGAIALYLDFVLIFIHVLRLLDRR